MNSSKLIYVAGPTASGKTRLAIALAKAIKTEIISCDSRQFYKEMKIGTAVPSQEEQEEAPHHFLQHLSIHESFSVGSFQKAVHKKLKDLFQKHPFVVMVGGSGLYADAVIDGLDEFPETDPAIRPQLTAIFEQEGIGVLQDLLKHHDITHYQKVDLNNPHRLIRALEVVLSSGQPYSSFLGKKTPPAFFTSQKIVIQWERESLYERINKRVDEMMAQGLEKEVKSLQAHLQLNALQTVGYREWIPYFEGERSKEEVIEEIKKNTRRYAKRQSTWFRRYKDAFQVNGPTAMDEALEFIQQIKI